MLRFALCLVAGMLAISGTRAQAPKQAATENQEAQKARPPVRLTATPGFIRLPSGQKLLFQLIVANRKGKTFTGTIVYYLGWQEQKFAVEGSIDEKGMMKFQEKSATAETPIHPQCPVVGGGKFETTQYDDLGFRGVVQVRLQATTKDVAAAILQGKETVKCDFVLGARALIGL